MPTIGIVALGACNKRSIESGLLRAGATTRTVTQPAHIAGCDALVIPGVAHFGYVASELDRSGLRDALLAAYAASVPMLGICVGFQLLFERSDEADGARGLGIFAGNVRRLCTPRVPHMGWNQIEPTGDAIDGGWAYFANAYAPDAGCADVVAVTRDGDDVFASAARRGSAIGVQFHPERSGAYGAALLERFVAATAVVYAR